VHDWRNAEHTFSTQDNDEDCGVFVCAYAVCAMYGRPPLELYGLKRQIKSLIPSLSAQ